MLLNAPRNLTDDELVERIATLTGAAREATAALVAHLAELEARGQHLARGFRSLYGYCRHVLHLSEHEAYNRMEAAHAARRFPVILPLLAEGRLHLTAVCLLAPRLGDENHLALLGGALHKSKREVDELLARWFPRPPVASSVRRVPTPHAVSSPAPRPLPMAEPDSHAGSSIQDDDRPVLTSPVAARLEGMSRADGADGAAMVPRASTPAVAPLDADLYQVKFSATANTIAKLKRAQELLSHAVPGGDVGEIMDRALDALLVQAARQKHAATDRPRGGGAVARASRTIPAAVEREVWGRDGGQCAYVGANGRRCDARRLVEFHHVKPWIAGGLPTADNIALRCRAHNAYEASLYFRPIRAAMVARTRSGASPASVERRLR